MMRLDLLSRMSCMAILNFIPAQLADHDVHFCEMAIAREAQQVPEAPHAVDNNRPSDTQLMDVFNGMEDAVRRQVAERLRGPPQPVQPPQMRSLEMNCHLRLIPGGNQSQVGSEQLTIQQCLRSLGLTS